MIQIGIEKFVLQDDFPLDDFTKTLNLHMSSANVSR